MTEIPMAELFLAGIFALISTEIVKWAFNISESSIGLHSSNTGELMKTRNATIIFTIIIFASNIIAFMFYNQFHELINSAINVNIMLIDLSIVILGIGLVWVYLKKNHYSRTD